VIGSDPPAPAAEEFINEVGHRGLLDDGVNGVLECLAQHVKRLGLRPSNGDHSRCPFYVTAGSPCGGGSRCAKWSCLANLRLWVSWDVTGGSASRRAVQREYLEEVDGDLRSDQGGDRIAKGRSKRRRWEERYLVVLGVVER
jgi:hypothetical protein